MTASGVSVEKFLDWGGVEVIFGLPGGNSGVFEALRKRPPVGVRLRLSLGKWGRRPRRRALARQALVAYTFTAFSS